MDRTPYRVTDEVDVNTLVAGQRVTTGQIVYLSRRQAKTELSRRVVEPFTAPTPGDTGEVVKRAPRPSLSIPRAIPEPTPVAVAVHPLDHDGDGRKGGSLPGRKRGRS